jgi:hypothetical protein
VGTVLAQNNFGDTMSDGLAGPMGLLIIVLLGIATIMLVRSMNKHLRRIPERFPDPAKPTDQAEAPSAAAGTPSDETN